MATKRRPAPASIRVVVSNHGGQWLAEGLEYHLTAQAPSWRQAINSFVRTLRRRLQLDGEQGKEPLHNLSPAPDHVFDAWDRLVEEATDDLLTQPVPPLAEGTPEAYVIHQNAKNFSGTDRTT